MPSSRPSRASASLPLAAALVLSSCGGPGDRPAAIAAEPAPAVRRSCSRALGEVTPGQGHPLATRVGQTTTCCSTRDDGAQRHYRDGFSAQSRGDADAAMEHYRAAIERDPAFCEPMVNLGLLLKDAGQLGEATGWYERARRANRDNTTAIQNLALAYRKIGRAKEAEALYRELLSFADGEVRAEGHFGLAQLLAETDVEQAERHARAANQLYVEQGSPLARDGALLVGLLVSRHSCSEALPYLQRAEQLAPGEPRAGAFLGACLAALGRRVEAEPYVTRARAAGVPIPRVADR